MVTFITLNIFNFWAKFGLVSQIKWVVSTGFWWFWLVSEVLAGFWWFLVVSARSTF